MPLSIQWRWKTPNVVAAKTDWEKNRTGESLTQAAQAIGDMRDSRRRKAIEDEDRARRIAEEDRRIQNQKDTAELIRQRRARRDQLVAERDSIRAQIEQLRAQLGG